MIPNVYTLEALVQQRLTKDRRTAQQQREIRLAHPRHRSDPQAAAHGLRHQCWIFCVVAQVLGLGSTLRTVLRARRVCP